MTPDSLIVITPIQLKKTNLIFLEHQKFSKKIIILENEIYVLNTIIDGMKHTDLIRSEQMHKYIDYIDIQNKAISDLNKELERQAKLRKNLAISLGCVGAGAIIGILLGTLL